MKRQDGYTLPELIVLVWIVLFVAIAVGWVKNLIKLTRCDFKAPYKAEGIHAVGLIPPVGAITGWMNPGK